MHTLDLLKRWVHGRLYFCRDNLRKLLDEAKRVDKTPTELIYDKVEDAIYSGISFSELLHEGGVDVS